MLSSRVRSATINPSLVVGCRSSANQLRSTYQNSVIGNRRMGEDARHPTTRFIQRRTTEDQRRFLRHYFRRYPLSHEGLDDVADFDVAVIGDRDAAFHAVGHLAGMRHLDRKST